MPITLKEYSQRIIQPQITHWIYLHGADTCAEGFGPLWYWIDLAQEAVFEHATCANRLRPGSP